ncbi:hypothetical protein MRB53_009356 [Persea americana]|uniref:Uncharacterized protein n=1 Tax=Persea americana TaxID=3435 RepID=A0ACC2LNS8_PERAE|nr:hypothetical protein MRB53_009356 [Persea americana]
MGKKTYTTVVTEAPKVEPKKKITKKNRVWDDLPAESKLDFIDPVDEKGDVDGNGNVEVVAADHGESMMDKEEIVSSESQDEESEDEEDEDELFIKAS